MKRTSKRERSQNIFNRTERKLIKTKMKIEIEIIETILNDLKNISNLYSKGDLNFAKYLKLKINLEEKLRVINYTFFEDIKFGFLTTEKEKNKILRKYKEFIKDEKRNIFGNK